MLSAMLKLNSVLLGAVLAPLAFAAPRAAALENVETDARVGVVSDYRWRGQSLSDESASLQAEATLSHESGAWLWGATNSVSDDLGGAEINLGAGYDVSLGGFDWSLGAIQYFYPGEDDLDYAEFDLSAARGFGPLTLTAGLEYSPEQRNLEDSDTYAFLAFEAQAAHAIVLHGHVGRDDGVMALEPHAVDYSIGATRAFGPLALDLTYVEAEGADSAFVLGLSFGLTLGS